LRFCSSLEEIYEGHGLSDFRLYALKVKLGV
jgi:hypothetical protein